MAHRETTRVELSLDPGKRGFTRVELMAVLVVCSLLLLLLICMRGRSAARSKRIGCTKNLTQIGLVFKTWSLDNGDKFSMLSEGTNAPGTAPTAAECFQ
ncbi:MAG TPA: hypothetical protein VKY92_14115 [Verrucomicrobiae bacterium]|nr:hypothetical protein [Verrucomicrobiae bacterium]